MEDPPRGSPKGSQDLFKASRKPKPLETSTKPGTVTKPTPTQKPSQPSWKNRGDRGLDRQIIKAKMPLQAAPSVLIEHLSHPPRYKSQMKRIPCPVQYLLDRSRKKTAQVLQQHQPPGKSNKRVQRIMREIGWASMLNTFRATSSCPSPNSLRLWNLGSCLWSSPTSKPGG